MLLRCANLVPSPAHAYAEASLPASVPNAESGAGEAARVRPSVTKRRVAPRAFGRLGRTATAALTVGALPKVVSGCSQVVTPMQNFVGLWSNDTFSGGNTNFDTAGLVRNIVRACNATQRQINTACDYLQGTEPVQRVVNGTVQVVVFRSPYNASVEQGFLDCTAPLLAAFVDEGSAMAHPKKRAFSEAATFGLVLAALVGAIVVVSIGVKCRERRHRRVGGATPYMPRPSYSVGLTPYAPPRYPAPARTYGRYGNDFTAMELGLVGGALAAGTTSGVRNDLSGWGGGGYTGGGGTSSGGGDFGGGGGFSGGDGGGGGGGGF